ncbi:hypothetical protein [Bradyrhizobium sp. dw_78]|uniref:hypothetical protein n=1 Tax=Bradyrhizobium sp. dw_78 TaxID=2719793 RepID=UPI001BD2F62C|nr:hypothetical protein [Bradyrhizobium sp. dw_78]
MTDETHDDFAPIYLGRDISPAAFDVAQHLATVPTLTEITARLGALPRAALLAAVKAEPSIYGGMIHDARDSAAYLRAIADTFEELADRLEVIGK